MEESFKVLVKEISEHLENYVNSKDEKAIVAIEEIFQNYFSAIRVQFWNVDNEQNTLQKLADQNSSFIPLDPSITKEAISTKSPLIINHVTSDKFYNQHIDNPLDLKVKALLLFPIVKGKKVLGIMRVWRGIKQKKVFTKQDEKTLKRISALLLHIIELKSMNKEEVIALIGTKTASGSLDMKSNKNSVTKTAKEKKHDGDSPVQDSEIEKLKRTISKYEKEIKSYKTDQDRLEKQYEELSTLITEYQSAQKKQQNKLETLLHENKNLKLQLKTEKMPSQTKSIQELKAEKNKNSIHSNGIDIENIETILHHQAQNLVDYEHMYALLECIIYSVDSKQAKADIEKILRRSKVALMVIDECYVQKRMQVKNDKQSLSDLNDKIKTYTHTIFSKDHSIKVKGFKDLPSSLVFDIIKVQSILLHLLIDLYQLLDNTQPLEISYTYTNKILTIHLGGKVHQQNSLLKSMFKQNILGGNDKERLGLKLAQKLVNGLNGNLEPLYKNSHYKFILSIPCKKIKM